MLLVFIALAQTGVIPRKLFVIIIICKFLATLHFLAGIYINDYALKKEQHLFQLLVLGGMGARLFITLPLLLLTQSLLNLNFNLFILLFFIFYFFFLALEIIYLLKIERQQTKIQ
jgi:hypothetical protein